MTRAGGLSGSCHCGAVRIQASAPLESLTECNCGVCRRYGALWGYFTRVTARVECAPDAVTAYLCNDRVIEFFHCNTCGCLTHYESVEKTPDSRLAINARMLAPADLAGVRVRQFDGAESWQYLEATSRDLGTNRQ